MEKTSEVVAYVRVSTEDQGESGLGIDAQKQTIENEIQRRSWNLVTLYTDIASGGSLDKRTGLMQALDHVRDGNAGTLMVAKLDRLSRSLMDFAALTEQARKQGWNLVALDLGVDLTTPSGEFLANVMASAAQWERRIIGQRTTEALKMKKSAGVKLGRPTLVSHETVQMICGMRQEGRSYSEVAYLLNTNNVPTPSGKGKWYASSIKAIEVRECAKPWNT